MPPPVLVLSNWDAVTGDRWHAALSAALPNESLWRPHPCQSPEDLALQAHLAEVEVALVASPPPGWLGRCPRLGLIQSLWAGVDRLLDDPTLPTAPVLARMVDPVMSRAMAETAHWAVLTLHRGFDRYARQQREHRWWVHAQRRADEVRVTVLGLGEMGRATARRLQEAGYRVRGWSRTPAGLGPSHTGGEMGSLSICAGSVSLPALLADTDILINLLPLTAQTRGLLNAEVFRQLPRGASVVNLARGAHLVEADLLAALDRGHLHHAVLDVFNTEPLPPEHPFWDHPAVTVLPHAAALTDERSAAGIAAENIRAWRAGEPVRFTVDRRRGY